MAPPSALFRHAICHYVTYHAAAPRHTPMVMPYADVAILIYFLAALLAMPALLHKVDYLHSCRYATLFAMIRALPPPMASARRHYDTLLFVAA